MNIDASGCSWRAGKQVYRLCLYREVYLFASKNCCSQWVEGEEEEEEWDATTICRYNFVFSTFQRPLDGRLGHSNARSSQFKSFYCLLFFIVQAKRKCCNVFNASKAFDIGIGGFGEELNRLFYYLYYTLAALTAIAETTQSIIIMWNA